MLSRARRTDEVGNLDGFQLSIGLLDTQRARRAKFADQRFTAHDPMPLNVTRPRSTC